MWGLGIATICLLALFGAFKLAVLIYVIVQRTEDKKKERFEERDH
jgi:hypothetical protein